MLKNPIQADIQKRMKPKAYSYIRWSSPTQTAGDSFRRQTELAKQYCREHGLTLEEDAQFYDRGTSGFRGKQKREGQLRRFLEMVESGEVKEGSFLLIEEIDRLSREEPNEAQRLILNLFDAGISIVTLSDGRTYSPKDKNLGNSFLLIGKIFQAHEESQKKADRGKANWKGKRLNAGNRKLTAQAPQWLKLSADKTEFHVIEDRAQVVREIFTLAIEGTGAATIARKLNERALEPWGRGKRKADFWRASYIKKILYSRAVLGEFQPHTLEHREIKENGVKGYKKERVPTGEPIKDYYPRIIQDELFQKAQEALKLRRLPSGGKISEKVSNLFAKVAVCGYCGSPMHYVNKATKKRGNPGWQYLVCSKSKATGECVKISWRYQEMEDSFLQFIKELDFSTVLKKDRFKLETLESVRLKKSKELEDTAKKAERLLNLVEEGNAPASVLNRLKALEEAENQLKDEIADLLSRIATEENATNNLEADKATFLDLIKDQKDVAARRKLVLEIRRKIDRILVCAGGGMDYDAYNLFHSAAQKPKAAVGVKDLFSKPYDPSSQIDSKERRAFSVVFKNGARRFISPANGTIKTKSFEEYVSLLSFVKDEKNSGVNG